MKAAVRRNKQFESSHNIELIKTQLVLRAHDQTNIIINLPNYNLSLVALITFIFCLQSHTSVKL